MAGFRRWGRWPLRHTRLSPVCRVSTPRLWGSRWADGRDIHSPAAFRPKDPLDLPRDRLEFLRDCSDPPRDRSDLPRGCSDLPRDRLDLPRDRLEFLRDCSDPPRDCLEFLRDCLEVLRDRSELPRDCLVRLKVSSAAFQVSPALCQASSRRHSGPAVGGPVPPLPLALERPAGSAPPPLENSH